MLYVSVLVPVYNVKPYLQECLDSLVAQTLEGIEFICIDDGSTDGCSEILDDYAAQDARFRVIHKANSGYGASMNVGLKAARGEYVGIVESDDFADPEMFHALYEAASRNHVDVVKSNCWQFQAGKDVFWEVLKGHAYGRVICPSREETDFFLETPTIWSCLYRRKFLLEQEIWFNETPGASYQDTSFVFLTKAYADSFLLVKEGYLHYRIDNPLSSVYSPGKIYSVIDEYDAVQRYIEAHPSEEYEKLCSLSAQLLYQNFQFTEKRLPRHLYPVFWAKAYPKLKAAQARGFFHEDLGETMEAWILHRYAFYQEWNYLRESFLRACRAEPKIYLFGAGQVARAVCSFLRQHGCGVAGMMVSRRDASLTEVDGVPVSEIGEASTDRERDVVIIATSPHKPKVQQEIFLTLEREGYQNVIVLTENLQRALAQAT